MAIFMYVFIGSWEHLFNNWKLSRIWDLLIVAHTKIIRGSLIMIMFCQVSATNIIYYLTSEEQVCGAFFLFVWMQCLSLNKYWCMWCASFLEMVKIQKIIIINHRNTSKYIIIHRQKLTVYCVMQELGFLSFACFEAKWK